MGKSSHNSTTPGLASYIPFFKNRREYHTIQIVPCPHFLKSLLHFFFRLGTRERFVAITIPQTFFFIFLSPEFLVSRDGPKEKSFLEPLYAPHPEALRCSGKRAFLSLRSSECTRPVVYPPPKPIRAACGEGERWLRASGGSVFEGGVV